MINLYEESANENNVKYFNKHSNIRDELLK